MTAVPACWTAVASGCATPTGASFPGTRGTSADLDHIEMSADWRPGVGLVAADRRGQPSPRPGRSDRCLRAAEGSPARRYRRLRGRPEAADRGRRLPRFPAPPGSSSCRAPVPPAASATASSCSGAAGRAASISCWTRPASSEADLLGRSRHHRRGLIRPAVEARQGGGRSVPVGASLWHSLHRPRPGAWLRRPTSSRATASRRPIPSRRRPGRRPPPSHSRLVIWPLSPRRSPDSALLEEP